MNIKQEAVQEAAREAVIESLMKEVTELTVDDANIILDSFIELLDRSMSIGHDVKLVDFGDKPLLFNATKRYNATKTGLSPLLAHQQLSNTIPGGIGKS